MKITLLTGKTYKIKEAFDFELKIVSSAVAKKMTLRIDSKVRLPVLTLPKSFSSKRAIEFIESNEAWIKKQLEAIPQTKVFQDQDIISIFGQTFTINHNPSLRAGVFIDGNTLNVSGNIEFLHRRTIDFIKSFAKKELTSMSKKMAAKIDCKVNNVVIKDTRTRWGSCSSYNNINYSWRLALAPLDVIRYLVAHEVSHLKHMDHSREFWRCVKALEPKTVQSKNWLKKEGQKLYYYK